MQIFCKKNAKNLHFFYKIVEKRMLYSRKFANVQIEQ